MSKDTRNLTFHVRALARLFDAFQPAPGDECDWGPTGPVVNEKILWVRGPAPGSRPEPSRAGRCPDRWKGMLVGRIVADRFVTMAQLADAGARALHEGVERQIRQFVDDWCGTPPRLRWPLLLPFPWPDPTEDPRVDPVVLVGMGVQFFTASERLPDAAVASNLADAGLRLAQTGLERLGQG
jgi:hypothetical protein